jgi:hypothetical protein
MASCTGTRKSAAICKSVVDSCTKCTNVGCDQVEAGECSNQGFRSGICLKCGKMKLGHELGLLVMTPQLQQAINVLRLSLPELNELVTSQLKKEGKRKA